ncbi:amino acid transporter [Rhizodiscina lignyota]|uniref:Amino acid transporter n=1 Tax=Rhizodiscina lignyota TaxID=1504668 RepID=A0A9P4M8V9_9PEZI|nr:amino acid transporter [Rhizodiscina lignyota]
MKKDLGALTLLAICFNICNSWPGLAGSVQIALLQGGPATLLYGMIISASLYISIALTMAELASVYPTAGGQYHFVSILTPKSLNRGLSYICGLLTNFSWIAIGASVLMIPSMQITALVSLYRPTYVVKAWHEFLIYEGFGLVILLYNLFAVKKLPRTHDVGFVLTLTLFVATTLTFVIRSSPKANNDFVWATFTNFTGWPDGVCFLTSLLTTCFIFAGLDASLHMAEEAPNPRVSVPRASVTAIGIGFVTAFAYGIVLLYSIPDFESIVAIEGYLPLEISRQGMRSDLAAAITQAAGVVMTFFVMNAVLETASRITWALARDNALIFPGTFSSIHSTLGVPIWSIILDWAILSLLGLVFLASTTAFNALLGSCVVLQQLSFLMPTVLLMYQRRSEVFLPRNRAFRLPNWFGWIVNAWVVVMSALLVIFFLLPPFLPVTGSNMNYNVVILGIAAILGIVNWFAHAKNHYQGPRIFYHD